MPVEAYELKDYSLSDWLKLNPGDFYFALHNESGTTVVFVVPVSYFNAYNKMYDESMPLFEILPNYLIETMECVYETDRTTSEVFMDLTEIGLLFSDVFQKYTDVSINYIL